MTDPKLDDVSEESELQIEVIKPSKVVALVENAGLLDKTPDGSNKKE